MCFDTSYTESLERFYIDKHNFTTLKNFVEQRGECSLRLLDCLVTNYARDVPDVHYLKSETSEIFDVYGQYKTQLKSFSKKQFDPFGRVHKNNNKKYTLQNVDKDEEVHTTIGQMNFFKWAIQSELLQYARLNTEKIEEYMQTPNLKRKSTKENTDISRKKGFNKRVKIHHVPRVETFP